MGQCVAGEGEHGRTAWALRCSFAPLGLFPAAPRDLGAIHDLGVELIGRGVASEPAMQAIRRRQRCGFYVRRERGRLTAAIALVLLNSRGLQAVRADAFDAATPDPAHAVRAGEAPQAVYTWGIGAATRESARALVACCWAMLDVLPVPFFARAATAAGRRLVTRKMAFQPYPGSTTGLLWWDVSDRFRRAA